MDYEFLLLEFQQPPGADGILVLEGWQRERRETSPNQARAELRGRRGAEMKD